MKPTINKLYENAIKIDNLNRLTREEKHEIVTELLKTGISQRALARQLNVPYSTIHDWYSLRQDNKETGIHLSLDMMWRKVRGLKAEDITDWGRIEMIYEKISELIRKRP